VLPIDNDWLRNFAAEIQRIAKQIFDDASQNPRLRGLCLQFLAFDVPNIVADVKREHTLTRSDELRFAIEKEFLGVSDGLYESLRPPGGSVASRISVVPESGCTKGTHGSIAYLVDYQAWQDFPGGNTAFVRPYGVMTNLRTGRHFVLQSIHEFGG
jgi:hypothetical protein